MFMINNWVKLCGLIWTWIWVKNFLNTIYANRYWEKIRNLIIKHILKVCGYFLNSNI